MSEITNRLRAVAENQSRVTGGVVRVDTNVFSQAADEIERLEDRIATFRQETEGLREVIITKHEQIAYLEAQSEISEARAGLYEEVHTKLIVTNQRLEARNARLLAVLHHYACEGNCKKMKDGSCLLESAGQNCGRYALQAIGEEDDGR